MPFTEGIPTPGAGRKGYEFEQAQLDKMRSILDKDLKIIERLQDAEEINPIDERKLAISQARVSKYLDKLHASRESKELSGEVTIQTPIYGNKSVSGYASDTKDIQPNQENPGSVGGDISQ